MSSSEVDFNYIHNDTWLGLGAVVDKPAITDTLCPTSTVSSRYVPGVSCITKYSFSMALELLVTKII